MPDTATIVLHAYNGARQLFPANTKWTAQTRDGRSPSGGQQTLHFDISGPSAALSVPFFDNLFDQYTVIGNAKGCDDSACYPGHVTDEGPVNLSLRFLAKEATPQFANATWTKLQQSRRGIAEIVARGCENDASAADRYSEVIERRPAPLACFLNIMTALADMRFPSGKCPL